MSITVAVAATKLMQGVLQDNRVSMSETSLEFATHMGVIVLR